MIQTLQIHTRFQFASAFKHETYCHVCGEYIVSLIWCVLFAATRKQECPPGYYSYAGARVCERCSPGYVCKMASTSPTPADGVCQAGGYCPDGMLYEKCPSGTYNMFNGSSTDEDCSTCPTGIDHNLLFMSIFIARAIKKWPFTKLENHLATKIPSFWHNRALYFHCETCQTACHTEAVESKESVGVLHRHYLCNPDSDLDFLD